MSLSGFELCWLVGTSNVKSFEIWSGMFSGVQICVLPFSAEFVVDERLEVFSLFCIFRVEAHSFVFFVLARCVSRSHRAVDFDCVGVANAFIDR